VKIPLDECVDERVAHDIAGHNVLTVRQMGRKGKKNGELLALAERHFEALVTTDRNLSFQQNLARLSIAVLVLTASTNRLSDLRPIAPALLEALRLAKKGEVREIGAQQFAGGICAGRHARWGTLQSVPLPRFPPSRPSSHRGGPSGHPGGNGIATVPGDLQWRLRE
jgi:hypothetical protein